MTAMIISKEEMEDIIETDKYLKESGLLNKGDSKTIEIEAKEQKAGFIDTLMATLGASLLGNVLVDKGGIKAHNRIIRAGQGF